MADRATVDNDSDQLLTRIVDVAVVGSGTGDWHFSRQGHWCLARPPHHVGRGQGWKLHLSATPLSAPIVLARAADVLVDAQCAFKFAVSLDAVAQLTGTRVDRSLGGKVITVYPDDNELHEIAAALHAATLGLPGPPVLSDRQYCPGSLVHYRFGVFEREPVLGNDGLLESRLVSPSGEQELDVRRAWFAPPSWVCDPFTGASAPALGPPGSVLLDGRFRIHTAVRHAYRGGVFRATDVSTSAETVVKHARPHVGGSLDGTDVRDLLRHEQAMLARLAPMGICPQPIVLVEKAEGLFLVQSQVSGVPLDVWALMHRQSDIGLNSRRAVGIAMELAQLVAKVQAAGLTSRDFNPSNMIVGDRDTVTLVDLEALDEPGHLGVNMYTRGYAAPEQVSTDWYTETPGPAAMLFSLGAVYLFLTTGTPPILAVEDPPRRPTEERVAAWLAPSLRHNTAARLFAPLILGLMGESPGNRWELDRVIEFLSEVDTDAASISTSPTGPSLVSVETLVRDGAEHLVATMTPGRRHLWRPTVELESYDPLAVQHGAAGALAVLVAAWRELDSPRLRDAAGEVAAWIQERSGAGASRLPGLYYGASGTAWALLDAGVELQATEIRDQAITVAREIRLPSPNPDICHGTAGAGMAQLHFWQVLGGDEFADRASLCAKQLADTVQRGRAGVLWQVPDDFDSALRGIKYYGYAHGVAGIGAFLLDAGRLLARDDLIDLAGRAGRTLVNAALVEDDAAWWGSGETPDSAAERLTHWCSGSAGVGTFLLRLHRITGDPDLLTLATMAARAVHRSRATSSTVQCHGLAGDGDFLLDLAEVTDEAQHREWAADIGDYLRCRAVCRAGRYVVPGENAVDITAAFGDGLSGILAFLLRLQHRGRRLFTLDDTSPASCLPGEGGDSNERRAERRPVRA
jgi:class IV lanthipeptide synthase